ncbi:MAG: tRNA 2-thiouridine(34) synthase MnmA [Planctomycetota bacterium]|nr:MAG: tRNA 2-thiouridine(34) synthase MnmA [Planctomycetota bacterium]
MSTDSSFPAHAPGARLVVAMSGGVDSSVTAWLLAREGHELVGLFMRNGVHVDAADAGKKSCCSVNDARDARMVAAQLGIPFQAVDLKAEFRDVIRHFLSEYAAGRTPNPCAVCNRDLKFGRLIDFADELGAAGVATGHYARIAIEDGRVAVRRGVDRKKDQSYQLFAVSEAHLGRARLPLGGYEKPAVRELAAQANLRTAAKQDSQEICFVPGNDYRKLLEQEGVELHPGQLRDSAGRELGAHAGTELFTVGQRKGHGIGGREPLYVLSTEPSTGTVVLGSRDECGTTSCAVDDLNWIGIDAPSGELRACVQVRYHHDAAPATIHRDGARARIEFDEPVLAVAPGQGAAFYAPDPARGDRLIGGGWIGRD